jgi:hypothetical protein
VNLPFDVRGMLVGAIDFIKIYYLWILVILGFRFLPTIYRTLDKIFNPPPPKKKRRAAGTGGKKKGKSSTQTRNRSSGSAPKKRSSKKQEDGLDVRIDRDSTGRLYRREIIWENGKIVSETPRERIYENRPPKNEREWGESAPNTKRPSWINKNYSDMTLPERREYDVFKRRAQKEWDDHYIKSAGRRR